jgi:hypothetical protein
MPNYRGADMVRHDAHQLSGPLMRPSLPLTTAAGNLTSVKARTRSSVRPLEFPPHLNRGSHHMSMTKRALLASGATLLLGSAPVRAQAGPIQGSGELLDQHAIHLDSNGMARVVRLNETGDAAVKKYGKEMDGHAMFYRQGSKHYVLHNQKMADGSMLFDRAARS